MGDQMMILTDPFQLFDSCQISVSKMYGNSLVILGFMTLSSFTLGRSSSFPGLSKVIMFKCSLDTNIY